MTVSGTSLILGKVFIAQDEEQSRITLRLDVLPLQMSDYREIPTIDPLTIRKADYKAEMRKALSQVFEDGVKEGVAATYRTMALALDSLCDPDESDPLVRVSTLKEVMLGVYAQPVSVEEPNSPVSDG